MFEQQLFVRASEIRPLQGQVRVPGVQEADGHPGKSERAHDQAAREEGERGLRGVREKLLAPRQPSKTREELLQGEGG